MPDLRFLQTRLAALALAAGLTCSVSLASAPFAHAVTMVNDPKGFNGIAWGAALDNRPDLTLISTARRIKEYDFKSGPGPLGEAKVEMMRLSTVDGKFARVTIRYRGQLTHTQVLTHLQAQYGPLDSSPGQTMRSFNQQFNWRGADTEINMTYDAPGERGFVFIESIALEPYFTESIHEQDF